MPARRLEPNELAEAGPSITRDLPLDLIDPNPRNPRRGLSEIEALAENIRRFGLQQPVTVRRAGDRYELLGGHRRLAAYQHLRLYWPVDPLWKTIPAMIRTADDDESYLMLLSAQVQMRPWTTREEAAALEQLVLGGRTVAQVGETLNRTREWASKRLRVYADSVLSGYVQAGNLSPGIAEEFLSVLDPQTRQDLAERAVAESWSQDKARGQVRALRLDRQLAQIAKQARALLDLLSRVDASRLPEDARVDLITLSQRIRKMATVDQKPAFPSLEAAERAAGVPANPRKKTGQRKAGYRPKL